MTHAAIWIEASLEADTFITWDAVGRPEAQGRLRIAGSAASTEAASWVGETGITSLIVMTNRDGATHAKRLAAIVCGAHPSMRCAVRVMRSNAITALIRAADAIRFKADPVATVALFDECIAATISGVWLRSVTQLREPTPSLMTYLRSLIPGGNGYLVVQNPHPRVSPPLPIPATIPPSALLVGVKSPTDEVPSLLAKLVANLPVVKVPAIVHPKKAYGSYGVEFMVDTQILPRPSPTSQRCPSCHLPLYSPICPHCHLTSRRKNG